MDNKINILYLEYETGDATIALQTLKAAGINAEINAVNTPGAFRDALQNFAPNLIIADDALPALNAINALDILLAARLNTPLIVVTAPPEKNFAANIVKVMKHGAYDYILKEHISTLPAAVTEAIQKHKDQEKLLQNEQHYRQIVETAQEGIWIVDENLKTTFVNKKWCDIIGYTAEEMMGKSTYDFKDEAGKLDTFSRNEKRKLGITETHESVFITKSGKEVSCIVATNGLFDADGKHSGTLGMMTDITSRKAHEDALKRSEANLSAIIENTTDLVYSLDTDFKFITFNQVFKNTVKIVYGFDIEQGVNTLDLFSTFSPELAEKWKNTYARALNGETLQFVNEYPNGDDKVYLSYSINPIWEAGKVIGLSCFSRDITRQKLDEAAIKSSEASLRTIINNTDMACLLIDSQGKIVSFNNLAKIYSETVKEGAPILEFIDENRKEIIADIISRTKNGTVINYQLSKPLNGEERWFDVTWAGIKDQKNDDFGCIFTIKDVTEKKKSELEREKITADLIQRNKALEQFTYIISHNLRAPVANIIGLSSLISNDGMSTNEVAEVTDSIGLSANKLDEVISDLNQVLQINEGINENVQFINLPAIVENIKYSIKHIIEKEQVKIICNFEAAHEMRSLKSYIHSILYNLVLNSIKYHNPGVTPVISIGTSINNDRLRIIYRDNGRGIDTSKYGSEIFGLYKRFDNSVEGKGMGLFMVKTQVESLGGTISLKSTINKGSEFILDFPNKQAETN